MIKVDSDDATRKSATSRSNAVCLILKAHLLVVGQFKLHRLCCWILHPWPNSRPLAKSIAAMMVNRKNVNDKAVTLYVVPHLQGQTESAIVFAFATPINSYKLM